MDKTMTRIMSCLSNGLLCAVAAACAPATPPKITEIRNYQANFQCEGDRRMHVQFSAFNAVLDDQGNSVALSQQPAADGFLYAGGGQSLRARGPEAVWTDGKGAVHSCREAVSPTSKVNSLAH
jgi:hypothetical protein